MKDEEVPEVLEHKQGYHVLFVKSNSREVERIKRKILSELFKTEQNCYGYYFDIPSHLEVQLKRTLKKIFK